MNSGVDTGISLDCRLCTHYVVTWDPRWPHGCTAMGFRSQVLPSVEVRMADGTDCLSFSDKRINTKEELNRSLFRGRHIDREC